MTEQTLEEKLNRLVASKSVGIINVAGREVNIRESEELGSPHYTASVEIKNSHLLVSSVIGYPTLREDDIVGVDTLHTYNEHQTPAERLIDAIKQITEVIQSADKVLAKASQQQSEIQYLIASQPEHVIHKAFASQHEYVTQDALANKVD